MTGKSIKRAVIIGVIAVAAVTAGAIYYVSTLTTFEVDVTITHINPATNTVYVEYMHPRRDKLVESAVVVPEDCEILLDGKPATLGDLAPGDTGRVRAEYIRETKTIRPVWVRMKSRTTTTRPVVPPATQPANH